MAEAEKSSLSLEAWLMIGLVVSVALSTLVIAIVSAGKTTVFSPYENGDEYEELQLTLMRESLDDFSVANTMSTPMLVNDWQNPHRTLLVIAAPEKPFDAAEAAAIHDFVTERAGKVILASNSTNAQLVAEEFGVKYFANPVRDDINTGRYYEVTNENDERISPDTKKLWSVASVTRDISTMGDEKAVPCSEDDVLQENVNNCPCRSCSIAPPPFRCWMSKPTKGETSTCSLLLLPQQKLTLERAILTPPWVRARLD